MTPAERRIQELESFNNCLLRERKLNREVKELEECVETRDKRISFLEEERVKTKKEIEKRKDLNDLYVTVSENTINMLVKERDDFRQEMSDLHDFMIDQFVHVCDDNGPNGCPVANLLQNNPKRGA